ncbi:MAG: heme exporter protein CcmD [Pseudomonadota bacterium]
MSELFDFGRYAPFIAAAYGASFLVLGGMIAQRRSRLEKAREAERSNIKEED